MRQKSVPGKLATMDRLRDALKRLLQEIYAAASAKHLATLDRHHAEIVQQLERITQKLDGVTASPATPDKPNPYHVEIMQELESITQKLSYGIVAPPFVPEILKALGDDKDGYSIWYRAGASSYEFCREDERKQVTDDCITKHPCKSCGSTETIELDTYKRFWHLCYSCGDAHQTQKENYPLSFLPDPLLKKSAENEEDMYDYFTTDPHIQISIDRARQFLDNDAKLAGIHFSDKRVLDISGGNGHFLMEIAKLGTAEVTLTEINRPTIDYAKKAHGIDVFYYNFNNQDLPAVVPKRFDIIMARAAVMFCRNLVKFAREAHALLDEGGLVVVESSITPTLGVMLRVQLDEFSYLVLRHPESVIGIFEKEGFALQYRSDEVDPSLYTYDHDMNRYWTLARRIYEWKNLSNLMNAERKGKTGFAFRARDRRYSMMVFRKT